MGQLLLVVFVLVFWAISAWVKHSAEARQREQPREPGAPPPPPSSGLDEIRRFLREISEPPRPGAPPTPPPTTRPRPPSAPGRPPTRRPVAEVPPVPRPPRRLVPSQPPAARPAVAVAAPAAKPPVRRRIGTLSEARVRERMRVEEVPREVERLAQRAERLVSLRPSKLVSLAPAIKAEAYEGLQRSRRRGLTELWGRVEHPLARAILYYEIVGPPLAIRRPGRTLVDYG